MNEQALTSQILNTWKIHNDVNLYLIGEIPTTGFKAVPAGSIMKRNGLMMIF